MLQFYEISMEITVQSSAFLISLHKKSSILWVRRAIVYLSKYEWKVACAVRILREQSSKRRFKTNTTSFLSTIMRHSSKNTVTDLFSLADIGMPYEIWSHRCSTLSGQSHPYCCFCFFSSSSSLCWECKCSAANLTSILWCRSRAPTSTHSFRLYWQCSR